MGRGVNHVAMEKDANPVELDTSDIPGRCSVDDLIKRRMRVAPQSSLSAETKPAGSLQHITILQFQPIVRRWTLQ